MLTLFHAPRTRSARVIWLLEELGDVPYAVETKTFKVPLEKLFAQETPYGKFPTLIDGDMLMFESGAIVQYILERYGNRGYRAAQLEAGILGGRLYLAAYAHHIGATGLTFLDDEVTTFFSPHAEGKSAIFLVAVGKAKRLHDLE